MLHEGLVFFNKHGNLMSCGLEEDGPSVSVPKSCSSARRGSSDHLPR